MLALVGSPIMAKAAKPTVRVNTTVRAAAAPEGVGRRAAAAGFLALILSTNAAPAEAETKRRAAVPEKKALSPYGYSGSGFGKYKAPRAFLKDEKAEVLKAYGLDTLPGQ